MVMQSTRHLVLVLAISMQSASAQTGPPDAPSRATGQPDGPAQLGADRSLALSTLTVKQHLTGPAAASPVTVNLAAAGSGKNGPLTAQTGLVVSALKDDWASSPVVAAVGEIDGLYINLRQGGATSDGAGILINAANTGQGFLAATEMLTLIYDPTTLGRPDAAPVYGIDLQDGVLDTPNRNYIGRVYNAAYGQLGPAMLVQSGGGHWGSALQVSTNGAQTLVIGVDGRIASAGDISGTSLTAKGDINGHRTLVPGVTVGGDAANGNIDLGGPNGTPYIGFAGVSGMRITGDAPNRLVFGSPSIGPVASVSASARGNLFYVNGMLAAARPVTAPSFVASVLHTPASSSEPCTVGQQAWDQAYEYRCVATNSWRRAALAKW